MSLAGKVAIVTGAGRNIGEAIACRLAGEGAKVAVVDVDRKAAESVAAGIERGHPGAAVPLAADVSRAGDVAAMVEAVTGRWGTVDVLVNNVAITDRKGILDLEEEEWDRVMGVTLKSVFLCTRQVARRMVDGDGGGVIVNIASSSGHLGRRNSTAYPTAKAGILHLTRCLAIQLGPYGIRVVSVSPNKIGSPVGQADVRGVGEVRNLVGRNGVPDDVAGAVAFVAGEQGAFVQGSDVRVDGGVIAMAEP